MDLEARAREVAEAILLWRCVGWLKLKNKCGPDNLCEYCTLSERLTAEFHSVYEEAVRECERVARTARAMCRLNSESNSFTAVQQMWQAERASELSSVVANIRSLCPTAFGEEG